MRISTSGILIGPCGEVKGIVSMTRLLLLVVKVLRPSDESFWKFNFLKMNWTSWLTELKARKSSNSEAL